MKTTYVWKTQDWQFIKITDMSTEHIINCLRMMGYHSWRNEYRIPLILELNRRNFYI